MSIFKSLVFAGLAATVSIINAEPHCPGNVDSLNLRLVQSSLIVVPVEINHTGPYDFVVDTGAQVSTIEPALASELHLKAEGNIGVAGVATYARTAYAYLNVIGAGEHSVPNTLAVIQDLTQLKEADSRIRGILGANFLEHFDVLIDNIRQILCLDGSGDLASTIKSTSPWLSRAVSNWTCRSPGPLLSRLVFPETARLHCSFGSTREAMHRSYTPIRTVGRRRSIRRHH
jgi:hypothetical protein